MTPNIPITTYGMNVIAKTGGPWMEVLKIDYRGQKMMCRWFDSDSVEHRSEFGFNSVLMLVPFNPPEIIDSGKD